MGVSGLTLGGGIGYLMGVAGAACDALIGADVIRADGRRLMVTDRSDPDLMWALRGAGANFGIVTRLVYRAVRLRSVLAGTLSFPAAAARDLLGLANNLSGVLPDELSVITAVVVPPRGEPQVTMKACWSGEAARGRDVIHNLVTRIVAPSAQTPLRSWADRAWGQLEPSMSDAYVNMLDDEGEARVREAYGANYARLQRLKRRYDPGNVLRSNQNIPPAGA